MRQYIAFFSPNVFFTPDERNTFGHVVYDLKAAFTKVAERRCPKFREKAERIYQ